MMPVMAKCTRFVRRSMTSPACSATSSSSRSGIGPRSASRSPPTPEAWIAMRTSAPIAASAINTRSPVLRGPSTAHSERPVATAMPMVTAAREASDASSAPLSMFNATIAASAVRSRCRTERLAVESRALGHEICRFQKAIRERVGWGERCCSAATADQTRMSSRCRIGSVRPVSASTSMTTSWPWRSPSSIVLRSRAASASSGSIQRVSVEGARS